jgi:hypothetical protein
MEFHVNEISEILVSRLPLEFGSQSNFIKALTELRWINKNYGKITQDDFEQVSKKYKLPIDFLEKGLSGISMEDLMVGKSKWFPIIYSWRVREKEYALKLCKFEFDYGVSLVWTVAFLIALPADSIGIFYSLLNVIKIDFTLWFSLLAAFILFYIPLAISLIWRVNEKKDRRAEYRSFLKNEGLQNLIDANDKFVGKHGSNVVAANKMLLKKLREESIIQCFPLNGGLKEIKINYMGDDEKLPGYIKENIEVEYSKRLYELK